MVILSATLEEERIISTKPRKATAIPVSTSYLPEMPSLRTPLSMTWFGVTFNHCINETLYLAGVQAVTTLGRLVAHRFFGALHRDTVVWCWYSIWLLVGVSSRRLYLPWPRLYIYIYLYRCLAAHIILQAIPEDRVLRKCEDDGVVFCNGTEILRTWKGGKCMGDEVNILNTRDRSWPRKAFVYLIVWCSWTGPAYLISKVQQMITFEMTAKDIEDLQIYHSPNEVRMILECLHQTWKTWALSWRPATHVLWRDLFGAPKLVGERIWCYKSNKLLWHFQEEKLCEERIRSAVL